jgi:Family of unknown function (DUF5675)
MITLRRISQGHNPVHGVLVDSSGLPICLTLENLWLDNQVSISCIVPGDYKVKQQDSPRFGPNMWTLQNVPGRTHILIHWGNTAKDTRGCILVGDRFGTLSGEPAVLNSRNTYAALRDRIGPEDFDLRIGWA